MAKQNLVYIAGHPLPNPSKYKGNEATLVDSARNVQGVVVGSVIRESVAKVEMDWLYITADEWAKILKLFNTKHGGNFYNQVRFFNQLTNDWTTANMYVGDRTTSGAFMLDPATGKVKGYTDAHLSLIEV